MFGRKRKVLVLFCCLGKVGFIRYFVLFFIFDFVKVFGIVVSFVF